MRNSFDWTPYRRSTVGFDRLFDFLETGGSGAENYPPFDIERLADDHFRITVAVAGFKSDEIDITRTRSAARSRRSKTRRPRKRRPIWLDDAGSGVPSGPRFRFAILGRANPVTPDLIRGPFEPA